jgi:hypothetical protein
MKAMKVTSNGIHEVTLEFRRGEYAVIIAECGGMNIGLGNKYNSSSIDISAKEARRLAEELIYISGVQSTMDEHGEEDEE